MPGMSIAPNRAAALARLHDFAPRMGRAYAAGRNTDPGPGLRRDVSELSPHIRHRLVTEAEMVGAALAHHTPQAAEKFIQEVFWRSYWKGFLELRPAMWIDYRAQAAMPRAPACEAAMRGETGIACFDAWALELRATGYLHNHVRMWFASIWIFTLRLPWVQGAEFFLEHLLDADAASNTLSWRWVAGIQTPGKHYLARAENIARYTEGRFDPRGELDEAAPPLHEPPPPPPGPLPPADSAPARVALLLHGDDMTFWPAGCEVVAVAGFFAPLARPRAPLAAAFDEAALQDGLAMAEARLGRPAARLTPQTLAAWAADADADAVVMPWAPVGWGADALAATGVPMLGLRRAWDSACWPLARKGFFPFRESIPALLRQLTPLAAPAP